MCACALIFYRFTVSGSCDKHQNRAAEASPPSVSYTDYIQPASPGQSKSLCAANPLHHQADLNLHSDVASSADRIPDPAQERPQARTNPQASQVRLCNNSLFALSPVSQSSLGSKPHPLSLFPSKILRAI